MSRMMSRVFFLFLVLLTVGWPPSALAQRLEVGIGGGSVNYKGDISPELNWRSPRLGGHVFLRHNPGKAISLTYSFMLGKFAADDKDNKDAFAQSRNRRFSSRLVEASAVVEYNFLNYRDEIDRVAFTPYLFAGVAVFRFEPLQNFKPDYNLNQIGIPFGLGIKYVIANSWNLGVAFGARKTFTDYLDDLGEGIDINNPLQNGNPNDKDMYFYSSVSVSYTFYKVRCPSIY